jgi:hypothetical protein
MRGSSMFPFPCSSISDNLNRLPVGLSLNTEWICRVQSNDSVRNESVGFRLKAGAVKPNKGLLS